MCLTEASCWGMPQRDERMSCSRAMARLHDSKAISPLRRRLIDDMTKRRMAGKTRQGHIRDSASLVLGTAGGTITWDVRAEFGFGHTDHLQSQLHCKYGGIRSKSNQR